MAKLNPADFGITGPIGNLSFYTRYDMPGKTLIRKKGGASKEKIQTLPSFARTRELYTELSGRATASKWIMQAMWPQKALANYNIAGSVNNLMKPIQALDTEGRHGQRHIMLSKNPKVLEGFSLNRKNGFDSLVRSFIPCSLSRETCSAEVNIPALQQGINLFPPPGQFMYSIMAVLGIVPDIYYSETGYKPSSPEYQHYYRTAVTEWFPVAKGSPAQTLPVEMGVMPPNSDCSLILSIGIRFGIMTDPYTVEQVRRQGAAKVLAMG